MEERFSVSLCESLRDFLELQRKELGLEDLDACVEWLIRKSLDDAPRKLDLLVQGRQCTFRRLNDEQFRRHARNSLALSSVDEIMFHQMRTGKPSLAETYASCRMLFGERGRLFDDWKGAFSFPLAVDIEGVDRTPCYLLNLYDYRSHIEFSLRQIVSKDDSRLRDSRIFEHDDANVSTEFLTDLLFKLIGYVEGFLQGYNESYGWKEPFLFSVTSELVVFGWSPQDQFFNRSFEESEDYEANYQTLRAELPTPDYYP